jgi:hypothetical protein
MAGQRGSGPWTLHCQGVYAWGNGWILTLCQVNAMDDGGLSQIDMQHIREAFFYISLHPLEDNPSLLIKISLKKRDGRGDDANPSVPVGLGLKSGGKPRLPLPPL